MNDNTRNGIHPLVVSQSYVRTAHDEGFKIYLGKRLCSISALLLELRSKGLQRACDLKSLRHGKANLILQPSVCHTKLCKAFSQQIGEATTVLPFPSHHHAWHINGEQRNRVGCSFDNVAKGFGLVCKSQCLLRILRETPVPAD